jgi:hypothetical protein
MPLSFASVSHGPVAFGFFNIASDMLLLEQYFFFCDDFCAWMMHLEAQTTPAPMNCAVFHIQNPQDAGDLMGAIHGIRFTGFIGSVYEQFPFPDDPARFKQNPEGYKTREKITALITGFARKKIVTAEFDVSDNFRFGAYEFSLPVFHELIRYVWQGGYPRWKDGIRPDCVSAMADRIQKSQNRFFTGVFP